MNPAQEIQRLKSLIIKFQTFQNKLFKLFLIFQIEKLIQKINN